MEAAARAFSSVKEVKDHTRALIRPAESRARSTHGVVQGERLKATVCVCLCGGSND